jgi:hypothetical protein
MSLLPSTHRLAPDPPYKPIRIIPTDCLPRAEEREEMEIIMRNNYKGMRDTKLLKGEFFGPLSQAPKPEKGDRRKEEKKGRIKNQIFLKIPFQLKLYFF